MKNTPIKLGALLLFCALLTLSYSCDKKETVYYLYTNERPLKKAGYSGEDISETVTITRDKTTRTAVITIAEEGEWEVYAGTAADKIDMKTPVLTGSVSGTYTLAVGDTCRVYFHVETGKGSAIMAERVLPMTGTYNFRDLGGYATTDGRHVKWGKILRSEAMASLNAKDLEYLKNLPLVSIIDFRGTGEGAADKVPETVKNQYHLPLSNWDPPATLESIYLQLVTKADLVAQYKAMFECLMDDNNIPLSFHCTAGRDRTGIAAGLILLALGVDEETIYQDYELTTVCFAHYPAWAVNRAWLKSTIDTVKSTYGSAENFFTDTIGLDLEAFRNKFLY